MEIEGPLPPHLRTYRILKLFPGHTIEQIEETPAMTWDWLLAIDAEVTRGQPRLS
jgi:hypothetical protein